MTRARALFLSMIALMTSVPALATDLTITNECYNAIVKMARDTANRHISDSSDQYHDVLSFTADDSTHYRVRLQGDDDAEIFVVHVRITATRAHGAQECVALGATYASGGGPISVGH